MDDRELLSAETTHLERHKDHPLLERDQERSLLILAQQGDRDALTTVVEHNQRLVVSIAMKFIRSGRFGDQELLDLIQLGNIGLLEAIQRWDSEYENRFITYATWWIKAKMRREGEVQAYTVARTARQVELAHRVRKSYSILFQKLARRPTADEIAEHSGLTIAIVYQIIPITSNNSISMDKPSIEDDEDSDSISDLIPSPEESPEETVEQRSVLSYAARIMAHHLRPKELKVLIWRYGLGGHPPATYDEIGQRMEVTRQRVQELEKIALKRIRFWMDKDA